SLLKLPAVSLLHEETLQRLRHDTDFVDRKPALVAGLAAILAARAALEGHALFVGEIDLLEIFFRVLYRLDAVGADGADESLGEERFDDGGEEEWLDIHVEQTRDAADGVVGVQRAED